MMKETRSPRPVLLTGDDDAHALAKIVGELSDRYGKGYCVGREASAEVGIEALKRCKADGEDVALVLADQWREIVAQHYRRVARYGGEDASRVKSGLGPCGDHEPVHGTSRIGPSVPCACSLAGL
jgi:hypothetical protein